MYRLCVLAAMVALCALGAEAASKDYYETLVMHALGEERQVHRQRAQASPMRRGSTRSRPCLVMTRRKKVPAHRFVQGVGRDASPAEIRRAYRRKAAKLHPDKTGNDASKNKQFQVSARVGGRHQS